jgi:hypothetical protein
MITTTHSQSWGHKVVPPSFDECRPKSAHRTPRYKVEASSYALFLGALEAKRAKWLTRRLCLTTPTIELPAENIAAIRLLDSWLSMPEIKDNDLGEGLRRRIDENRLSEHKFFS